MIKCVSPQMSLNERGIYEFTKQITLNNQKYAKIRIYASSRYILYINNEYICEGPCRGSEDIRYYDEIENVTFLKDNNEIRVVVMHLKKDNEFSTVFKTEKPMLLFEADFTDQRIVSDKSWSCNFQRGRKLEYTGWKFLAPNENVNVNCKDEPLVLEEIRECKFDSSFYNRVGVKEFPTLEKRCIPNILPQKETPFLVVKSGQGYMELDAGRYVTAKVRVKIRANCKVKLIYSECYEQPEGKKVRDDSSGILKGAYDTVQTAQTNYIFETFWFRAFRFLRVESENPQDDILEITYKECYYPLDMQGTFECSDESFNEIFKISAHTMMCSMHEILVDCPYYEQQQYIMDAAIESAVLMRMSSDVRLIKKCICEFAESQHADGLLSANYPCGFTQIIPGFSLFWIFLLKDYLEYSGDLDFVRKFTGNMDRILSYFDEIIRKSNYITKSNYWDYVDWVPNWNNGIPNTEKEEALTIYNLYYAYALKCAEYIAYYTERKGLASEYDERYKQIKSLINQYCFDEEAGLYRDGSKTKEFSQHTIIFAILSEVVSQNRIKEMIKRLQDESLHKSSFSMNYYLFRALEKSQNHQYIFQFMEGWKKMLDLNCTTWCENPDSPRSECHGWSSAPLYEFSANLLGVKYDINNKIIIEPYLLKELSYAKGTVPTRHGQVVVEWKKNGNEYYIFVKAPEYIEKIIKLPTGNEIIFQEKEKEIRFTYT